MVGVAQASHSGQAQKPGLETNTLLDWERKCCLILWNITWGGSLGEPEDLGERTLITDFLVLHLQ